MATENDKNKLGIVLAIVAGLLAMGMVFVFLQKMKKDARSSSTTSTGTVETKTVLVAVQDLPSGHVLSVNKDLTKMDIPLAETTKEFAQQCVPADRASELEGRRLGVAIAARFPLLFSNLVGSTRIDDDFTDGYLKTIEISKVNLIGNQLTPGDHVVVLATVPKREKPKSAPAEPKATTPGAAMDPSAITSSILASMPNMDPAGRAVETLTVLSDAEVFLVGSMRKMDRVQMGFFPSQRTSASEITFRLTMVEALKLTQYENTPGAKLTLLLRPRKKNDE